MRPQDFDAVLALFRGTRSLGDDQAAALRLDLPAMRFTATPAVGDAVEARCDHLDGELVESSEIAFDDDLFVAVERYSGAEFLPISGPMMLRVLDADDLAALLDHARAADRDGALGEMAMHPYVHVADQCGLGRGSCGGTAHRTFVTAQGEEFTTVVGAAPHGGDDCASRCQTPEVREALAALAPHERMLIARYLEVLDVARALAQRYSAPCRPAVLGASALADQPVGSTHVLRLGDGFALFDPATRAVASIGHAAAEFVRAASRSREALDEAAGRLGMTPREFDAATVTLARNLEGSGIRLPLLSAA
ncbi:MAG: hypothetical protein QM679_04870 [Patulibacter sp.]